MNSHSSSRPVALGLLPRATFACFLALPTLALAGCGSDAPPTADDCNIYAWEPGQGDISSFPTSDALIPDVTQPTGYLTQLPEGVDLEQFGPLGSSFGAQLVDVDGVSVQGEMWLGFSGTFDADLLPVADGEAHATDGLGIVVLPEDSAPYLVPVQTRTSTNYLYVRPLLPLPEATRVALFATRALSAAAGGCLEPVGAMRRLLRHPDDARRDAIEGLRDLGAISGSRDLVALHAVTTQSITRESIAIAEHIESLSPALTDISCIDEGTHRSCTAMLTVEDYRDDEGGVSVDVDNVVPDKTWALPVAIWLPPASVAGPYPTIVFGHGLGLDRFHAQPFAERYAERGWATVAIDALVHGDHPSTGGERLEGFQLVLRFFGLDLGGPSLDARRLRDHWRQSTYDKLQLARALTTVGDLDGDTVRDVDISRLAYVGVSLGGIMSTELVAMSDSFSAVVNLEGGGLLTGMISDPDSMYYSVIGLLLNRQSPDQRAQAFSLVQLALDRGDGATYAQHILLNRLRPTAPAPDYLFVVNLDDNIVPNSSNYALARALGLPLVGTVVRPVLALLVSDESLPLSGNVPGGATMGLLQFDVLDNEGSPSTHNNMPTSELGHEATISFLASHFDDGVATLSDPYVQLGVAHGPISP